MPYPTQPPYEAGALLQPRQLQRWLDVNKVSKLTRTETYWTLPAFSVNSDWLGYSKIVTAFDFVATNNFSIPLDYDVPSDPNFCPCIMWVDEDLNVYRYRLWGDVGEVFFFDAPVYSGQLIKKNFRIEIWDVEQTDFSFFGLLGSGTSAADQLYTYSTAVEWNGNGDIQYDVLFDSPVWVVKDNVSLEMYQLSNITNFPFGIWEVLNGLAPSPFAYVTYTVVSASAQTFFTSVAGEYDYMWQNDNVMAECGAILTNFTWAEVGVSFPLPFEFPNEPTPNE